MRKITILLTILFFWSLGYSTPVTPEKARQAAISLYRHIAPAATDYTIKETFTTQHEGLTTFYTFNFTAGGFVIIAADDASSPVLGYSPDGIFPQQVDHPAVKSWMDAYSQEIADIVKAKLDNRATSKEWNDLLHNRFAKGGKDVSPLIQTLWDQDANTNLYCPVASGGPGGHSPAGCVAIVMAQIIRYYQFPVHGHGSHSYVHPTYGLQSADFENTTYDYANMPLNMTGASNLERQAVSRLCYHCGVGVNMNYGVDASGAQSEDVPMAMAGYFGYDLRARIIAKADYPFVIDFKTPIIAELELGHPVYYSGSTTSNEGHAFICDGYQSSTGKFHFNWGWGGYSNGYYSIGALNPIGYQFNQDNQAILGLKPGVLGVALPWTEQASGFSTQSRGITHIHAYDTLIAWALAYDGVTPTNYILDFTHTANGGETWTAGTITNHTGYGASMICGIDSLTAWVPVFNSTNGGGKILKTSDGGATWVHQSTATFTAPDGFPNVAHFWNATDGWCMGDPNGGYFEMYTTTDGGDTWTRVPQANIPTNLSGEYGITGMYDYYGDTVWFGTNKGRVFKSVNRGLNWTVSNTGFTGKIVKPTFANGQLGVVQDRGTSSAAGTGLLKRTTDGGATWTAVTSTGPLYDNDVSFIPGTTILVTTGADTENNLAGISYSFDAGNTFIDFPLVKGMQFLAMDMVDLHCGYAGAFNYSATLGGMWKFHGIPTFPGFTADVTTVAQGIPVTFTNTSTGVDLSQCEWNFGDGAEPATANGFGPHSVIYSAPGTKTVTLTVTVEGIAYTETKTDYITVTAPVLVSSVTLTADNDTIDVYQGSLQINAAILPEEATNKNLLWSVSDTTLAMIEQSGVLTALHNGTVTVTATATDGSGVSGTIDIVLINQVGIPQLHTRAISVYPNPAASFIRLAFNGKGTVSIFNSSGQLVQTCKVVGNMPVKLNNMGNGLYLLKLDTGSEVFTSTFTVKQ